MVGSTTSRLMVAAAWLLAGTAGLAHAGTTPVFRNNNYSNPAFRSAITGFHDVDITTGSPGEVIATMPSSGTIPGTAALLDPFDGSGNLIAVAGGSSKAKGGAGHTEGSNLAKITFPSGTGLDQTDPAPHDVGPSRYTIAFTYKWSLFGPGTLGPPMSGTFSIPLGVKVGTGAGAYAKFAWDIKWDAIVDGNLISNIRSPYNGSQMFTGAGTYVTNVTAPAALISPSTIATDNSGGSPDDDMLIVYGAIQFEANNDDSRTIIEVLGPTLEGVDDELRNNLGFLADYMDPLHPEYRIEAYSGFEEVIPEPSSALIGAVCLLGLARRNRA